jgi:hypothetical protein
MHIVLIMSLRNQIISAKALIRTKPFLNIFCSVNTLITILYFEFHSTTYGDMNMVWKDIVIQQQVTKLNTIFHQHNIPLLVHELHRHITTAIKENKDEPT